MLITPLNLKLTILRQKNRDSCLRIILRGGKTEMNNSSIPIFDSTKINKKIKIILDLKNVLSIKIRITEFGQNFLDSILVIFMQG